MRTEFFKDWSEEAISKKADELNNKFNEALIKLYCAAAEGSVKDYGELRDKIIEAGCAYAPDLYDMGMLATESELYQPFVSTLDEVKAGGKSLEAHASQWLEAYGAIISSH